MTTLAPTRRPDAWTTFGEAHPDAANRIDDGFRGYYGADWIDDLDKAKTDVDRLAKFIAWQALLKGWRAVEMGKVVKPCGS